jgi:hypothetical protein
MDHQVYPAGVKSKTHEPKNSHLTFLFFFCYKKKNYVYMTDGCSAIKIRQKQSLRGKKKKNLMGVVPSFRNKKMCEIYFEIKS